MKVVLSSMDLLLTASHEYNEMTASDTKKPNTRKTNTVMMIFFFC